MTSRVGPACEGMVLGELVGHVGSVRRLVTEWVGERSRWSDAPTVTWCCTLQVLGAQSRPVSSPILPGHPTAP